MDESPINRLPQDTVHQIFSSLPLRQIMICKSVCKFFYNMLTSPSFVNLISVKPPLRFLALRPPHHHHHHPHQNHNYRQLLSHPSLHVYDPDQNQWLKFNLTFLPFRTPHPVASAGGLVYFWCDSPNSSESGKSLVVCNPLTSQFQVLPQLGSAWSKHGAVLVDSANKRVMVLTELAFFLYLSNRNAKSWLSFSSNLPSKPRSPVLVSESVFALCDVGSPWRSQWKLFTCKLSSLNYNNSNPNKSSNAMAMSSSNYNHWMCLEKHEWADLFDIVKRPRLVRGNGSKLLMIGGLKSTFSLNPPCSTILILRLDLERLEWEEAGRMPVEMYRCFQESSKLKVFGGGDRVCFSAKRVGKLALWVDCGGDSSWRWIDGAPYGNGGGGGGDGLWRGFVFEARLAALP